MFKARRCGDDGADIVLSHKILVSGCVEVAQQEFASAFVLVGWQNDVVGPVLLLSIIIMKHQLL